MGRAPPITHLPAFFPFSFTCSLHAGQSISCGSNCTGEDGVEDRSGEEEGAAAAAEAAWARGGGGGGKVVWGSADGGKWRGGGGAPGGKEGTALGWG